ncbi:unnamed protein product [Rhizophagus irregularis]|uniref:DUF8211 domain-containing protein n=1 Tax=Rhizophagus irregularis TaxID=588596 RepID=A0A915Z1C6_9GLOM|nr:unnamed protein product [Rhizophagus irregularis]
MTSSNFIAIDWSSSSSTHSFIRIDDPSFSQDSSLYPTPDIDSQTPSNNNNKGVPIKDISSISPISSMTTPPNGLSIPPRRCEVPSPIVMSNNRYGCGLHFFKKYLDGIIYVLNENGDLTPKIQRQNKQLHANLTFDRWLTKESKSIFSSRTGISYNSRYIVCNSNRKTYPGRTHIYHKLMNNFQFSPSPNARTAKKQKIRFERSCCRVLSQEVIKPGAVSSTSTKLAAAKKGRFLFLPSQKFTTPVKHLHYKKTVDIPKQKDYNFTIPHCFSNTRDERLRKADDAKFDARIAELTAASEDARVRYHQHQDERSKELANLRIQEDARVRNLAIYHGASPKHVTYRQCQTSDLTRWTDTYHNHMTYPHHNTPSSKKKKKKKKILQAEMESFLINYPHVLSPLSLKCITTRSDFHYFHHSEILSSTDLYTSDDIKEIEARPLKRDDHNFDNNFRSYGIPKCSRLDTPPALDSEQMGSST